LVREKLGIEITVPPEPQIVGAIGAALIAKSGGHLQNTAIEETKTRALK